jgi:putative transposase
MEGYRRGRHSVSRLYAHLVFVVKYRRRVLLPEHIERLREIAQDLGRHMDFEVLELNGESDHVHVLVEYPPKLSISRIVNHLKGVSSRLLRSEYGLNPHPEHFWSPAYFAASAGGAPLSIIEQYVEQQGNKEPS